MARTGRRPGASGTREAILDATREVLAREGYDRATIRGIARRAKVDPSLVLHYFHSKEALFVHAMRMPINPAELMRGMLRQGHAGLGRRVVETVLRIWGDRRNAETLVGFFRSTMSNERATAMFRQWLSRAMLGSVRRALATPDAELRAALVSSQIVGLIVARHILRLRPLTQARSEALVDWIGPTIQRYLTGACQVDGLGVPTPREKGSWTNAAPRRHQPRAVRT